MCRVHIGVSEGGRGEGRDVERGKREAERVKRELIAELSGLQLRKQELLTQLSSLAPPTVSMEMLHRIRDSSHDLQQQMGERKWRLTAPLLPVVSDGCGLPRELSSEAAVEPGSGCGAGEPCV